MKASMCSLVFVFLCAVVFGAEQSSVTGRDGAESGLPAAAAGSAGKEAVAVSSDSLVVQPASTEKPLRVPPGFRAKEGTAAEPYTNTDWAKEVVHEKTGIEMVFIPAGEFQMGSNEYDDEKPIHTARIARPFYMGKYEVTQTEWLKVTRSCPSKFTGDRNPVDAISWGDCQDFARKAGDGLRMPTEAEWEYACRAGTATAFYFGDTISTDQANYNGNYAYGNGCKGVYRQRTVEVGSFPPNGWGLYDMHGNVWEWCADWYDSGHYQRSPSEDPQGPSSGQWRVVRGGSWHDAPEACRSAYRDDGDAAHARARSGLRVARTLD